eukprot:3498378-Rhodomonas_salina.2
MPKSENSIVTAKKGAAPLRVQMTIRGFSMFWYAFEISAAISFTFASIASSVYMIVSISFGSMNAGYLTSVISSVWNRLTCGIVKAASERG